MGYIGQTPSAVPLDGDDIADDIVDSQHYAAGSIDTAHLADDQITLAKMAAGTDGNIISYDASGNPVAIATGSDGQVLTSAGAGAPPAFEAAAAGGKLLQVASSLTTTNTYNTAQIPADTSIPQNNEGIEITTLAFSPTASDSSLYIYMQFSGTRGGVSAGLYYALFVDSTANALALGGQFSANYGIATTSSSIHIVSAASTSERTYKLRAGVDSGAGNTLYVNRTSASANQTGNKHQSGLIIYEIGA